MRGLFLLFICMPIIELMLLFKVGSLIGALPTIALVVATAFIGINILKRQGFSTLTRAQNRLNAGELPGLELVEGFMLAIGGALLLTPGFVTDAIGFTLLIPYSRRPIARWLINSGRVQAFGAMRSGAGFTVFRAGAARRPPQDGDIVEGEVVREPGDEDRLPPRD